jgi:hypothetical protein
MASCRSAVLLLLFLGLTLPVLGADGMFQGRVVDPPANQPVASGWIYVEGRNHLLRRVEVSHAAVVFSNDVPDSQRHKCGTECLIPGQEIRVTAEQDSSGEWRAKRIEILKLATHKI